MGSDSQKEEGYRLLGVVAKRALLRGQFVLYQPVPKEYQGDFERGFGNPASFRLARAIGFAEAGMQENDWLRNSRWRTPLEEYAFCVGEIINRRLREDLRYTKVGLTERGEQNMPVA